MSEFNYFESPTTINTDHETIFESKSYQLLIHNNEPRYLKYKQCPQEFQKFINAQLSLDRSSSAEPLVSYEPIMEYENLSDITNHGDFEVDELWELQFKLTQLYSSIEIWDLEMVSNLFQSEKFNGYLNLIKNQVTDDETQLKIIKKLIIEQIGVLVRPFKSDKNVKERELNLVMLLYS